MAIRSGLGGQVGVSKEAVYGTYVTIDHFTEIASESLQKLVNRVDGGGFAAGRLARLASRRVETNTHGEGSITMQVPTKGFGVLLENLMGGTNAPVQQGGTTAYLQTHDLDDNWGNSLSIQKGVVDIDTGTARPYTFLGSKIVAAEFACGVDEDLQATLEVVSREVSTSQGLVTASYPTGLAGFTFGQGTFKTGTTVGGATSTTGVRRATCRIERPMKTDRFTYGQGGLMTQPILNDYTNISGTIDIDFMNTTDFVNRFLNNTTFAIDWVFEGATISGAYKYKFEVQLPACILDGNIPTLDGPEVSQLSVPYVVRSDGTNPVATILYQSTDTTV